MSSDKTDAQQGARSDRRDPVHRTTPRRSYAQTLGGGTQAASSITHPTMPTMPTLPTVPPHGLGLKATAAATGGTPGGTGRAGASPGRGAGSVTGAGTGTGTGTGADAAPGEKGSGRANPAPARNTANTGTAGNTGTTGTTGTAGIAGTGAAPAWLANGASTSTTGTTAAAPPRVDETGIPELERMKGVGETLNGRFVLEECIGFGGMGTVYKALDLRKLEASDRKPYIAIKVLNVQFRGHPKSLIALQREARKAQALAHPNIVAVYDFDRDGSMVYLTMEYLVGQPLSRVLRAIGFAGMTPAKTLPIVRGMANALAYAHERGFVHCDLKPANVFLTERGAIKVIDFGIARVFQKPEEDNEATVFDAGSLGGLTPAYASPEMLERREPDPRDDIYALACITYEMLTGRHPFDRMAATQARNIGMKPLRPKDLGWLQWRALRRALCFEREARTPSVTRFMTAFGRGGGSNTRLLLAGAVMTATLVATAFLHYRSNHPAAGVATATVRVPSADGGPAAGQVGATAGADSGASGSPARLPADANTPAAASGPIAPRAGAGRQPVNFAAIAPLLAQVPCSALTASTRENAIDVRGFLSQRFGAASLKAMLARIPGVDAVNLDVQSVADRECGMVELLAPFWARSRTSGASIRTRAPGGRMAEGEPLVLDLATPAYDSWVHVDYYVLDGGVVHLLPSVRARDNQAPPSYRATIGGLGNWVISRPFGSEMIVLTTTPEPLFSGLRAENENARDYLRSLKKQLQQMTAKYGVERVAVDFVQITTRAQP